MNKNLFLGVNIIMIMLLIPLISGAEWDNVKSYDAIKQEVTIENAFGLPNFLGGYEIAKVKLDTPLINKVGLGYVKVAEFTIDSYTTYENFIQEFEILNVRTGKVEDKKIDLKYKSTKQVLVPEFKEVCTASKDIKNATSICSLEKVGDKYEIQEEWLPLEKMDIKVEKLTVGIFTETQEGDRYDWIPTFAGVKTPEFAEWVASLNTNLISYYDFEETGEPYLDSVIATSNDLTTKVGTVTSTATGKIGRGISIAGGTNYLLSESLVGIAGGNVRTTCFWLNSTNLSVEQYWLSWGDNTTSYKVYAPGYYNATSYYYQLSTQGQDIRTGVSGTSNQLDFHCIKTTSSKDVQWWKNGANIKNITATSALNTVNTKLMVGSYIYGGTAHSLVGMMDEVGIWNRTLSDAEIVYLYNGGAGMTLTPKVPIVTLNSPINAYNSSSSSITFNATAVSKIGMTNVSLYLNGVLNETNTSGINAISYLFTKSLSDGNHNWSINSCNSDGCTDSDTRTLYIDTISPVVNITYPTQNLEIITFTSPANITLNFSATDGLGTLSSCWYNNGTDNITIVCNANTSINLTEGSKTISYYANDTLGNLGSVSRDFSINYIRSVVNYSLTGIELENTTIYFNVTATDITQANATVNLDGTAYAMTINNSNATEVTFYKTLTLPEVTADTIKSFNISYNVNDVAYASTIYNITVYNIPALNVSIDLCAGTPVYWFTLKDEENGTIIPGEFEYNFYYGLSNSSMVRTYGKITGATNFSICTNNTISPTWTIGSGEVYYSSTGYVDRRYYIFDDTVVTSASNLTLYDLISTSQTSFKLEIEDTSLNPYSNIYAKLFRWYPDLNEYKTVDIGKTDEKGSTVIHVRTEDVDYRIGAYETNGTLIYLADPIRMVCLASPCTYTLKISPGEIDYTSLLGITYTFTYNETTGIWDFVYSDDSGKTNTMNLTIYRITSTSEYAVCSDSISGSAGALSCNTSIYTTGILKGTVTRSASPGVPLVQKVVHLITSAFKGSSFGLWLSLLLAIPVIFLLCLISPIGALFGGIIALIPALYFGSINIGIVGGLAVLAGIVAHFLKRVS